MRFGEDGTIEELLNTIRLLLEQRGGVAVVTEREIVDLDTTTEIITYRNVNEMTHVIELRGGR